MASHEIKIGMLCQYKEASHSSAYGYYFPKCPPVPYAKFWDHGAICFQTAWKARGTPWPPNPDQVTKKYVLFVTELVKVYHPRVKIEKYATTYAKCLISDPYLDGETIDGWVDIKNIEALTEYESYEKEFNHLLKEKFLQLREQRKLRERDPK